MSDETEKKECQDVGDLKDRATATTPDPNLQPPVEKTQDPATGETIVKEGE